MGRSNRRKVKPAIRSLMGAKEYGSTARLYSEFSDVKDVITYSELAERIAGKRHETIFVLDSSFIPRHEVDWCVWEALLRKRIVIPPLIWQELGPWLATPFSNGRMAEVIRNSEGGKNRTVLLDHETAWSEEYLVARQYYVTLLSWRKQRSIALVEDFVERNGREPGEEEKNRLWQAAGTERDFHLLRKGAGSFGNPNYFGDEDLVVTAGMIAFGGGCNAVILTRDADVLEQFLKFTGLLTWHYQAMLFGELYGSCEGLFATRPMPLGVPELDAYFDPAESFLVRKHVDPDAFVDALLPPSYEEVRLTCLLFGGHPPDLGMNVVSYVGEKGLDGVIRMKGLTRGLSTDRLGGKNCHVTGFPIGIDEPREWVVVARDKTKLSLESGLLIANLDLAHTAQHFEVVRNLRPLDEA